MASQTREGALARAADLALPAFADDLCLRELEVGVDLPRARRVCHARQTGTGENEPCG
jgi:hypothetical protein